MSAPVAFDVLLVMDWEAVATLLEAQSGPAAVLDRDQSVWLLDARLAQLLGVGVDDPGTARLVGLREADALFELVAEAFGGASRRGECSLVTALGQNVDLVVEAVRVGAGEHASVVVVVHSAFVHAATTTKPGNATPLEYEIGSSPTSFGRLVRLTTHDGVRHYWGNAQPRCHEIIHDCSTPCGDCPVLRPIVPQKVTVRPPRHDGGPYEVLDVHPNGPRLQVGVRRIEEGDMNAIYASKLRAAKSAALLTGDERAVFDHLVARNSPSAITSALGISLRRMRQVQASILRKLDPSSRADLMRLLF